MMAQKLLFNILLGLMLLIIIASIFFISAMFLKEWMSGFPGWVRYILISIYYIICGVIITYLSGLIKNGTIFDDICQRRPSDGAGYSTLSISGTGNFLFIFMTSGRQA